MTENRPTDPLMRPVKNGIELPVIVLPRSSRNAVIGLQENSLKIKISKPPVDGQANVACCRLLAKLFNLAPSNVTVVRGHTNRRKTFRCEGITLKQAQEVLKGIIQD